MIPRTAHNLTVPVELVQSVTPVHRRNVAIKNSALAPGNGLDAYDQNVAAGRYETRTRHAKPAKGRGQA